MGWTRTGGGSGREEGDTVAGTFQPSSKDSGLYRGKECQASPTVGLDSGIPIDFPQHASLERRRPTYREKV